MTAIVNRNAAVGRAEVRQRGRELSRIEHQALATQEAVYAVNETGREAIREVMLSAMARNQAMQMDPAGADVYIAMWIQTAQDSQSLVHGLARRLR